MNKSIIWIALFVVFAFISTQLYLAIDSEWAVQNNATVLMTIFFFISATITILFGFKAVDPGKHLTEK